MSNHRDVWFAWRWPVFLPKHWKGWLATALFLAAVGAILAFVQFADANVQGEARRMAHAIGGGVGVLAAIAFLVAIIRHSGD